MPNKRAISDLEAARYLGVSASLLRKMRCYGNRPGRTPGPPYFKIGRSVRYLIEDLDQYIETSKRGASP